MKSKRIAVLILIPLLLVLSCSVQSRYNTRHNMTEEEQVAIDEMYTPTDPEEEAEAREPEIFLSFYQNTPVIRVNGLLIPADGIQDLYEYFVSFRTEDDAHLKLEACENWIGAYAVAGQWPETVDPTINFLIGIREQARLGGNFVNLVVENTQEPGSDETGGVLPTVGRGMMVPIFEMYAFTNPVGQVSGPFPTMFGWHLIEIISRNNDDPGNPTVDARHLLRVHGDNPENINQITEDNFNIWRGHATVEFLVPEMADIYPGAPIMSLEELEAIGQSWGLPE